MPCHKSFEFMCQMGDSRQSWFLTVVKTCLWLKSWVMWGFLTIWQLKTWPTFKTQAYGFQHPTLTTFCPYSNFVPNSLTVLHFCLTYYSPRERMWNSIIVKMFLWEQVFPSEKEIASKIFLVYHKKNVKIIFPLLGRKKVYSDVHLFILRSLKL